MISIEDAISKYFHRNEEKLKSIFVDSDGNSYDELQIKSLLRRDAPEVVPYAPSANFKTYKRATEFYNEYLEFRLDEKAYDLRKAKREALANTPGIFDRAQSLNKKINKNAYIEDIRDLGSVRRNNVVYSDTLLGYYDIKNSDYVLAKVESWTSRRTKIERWEFITKEQAGVIA